MYIEPEGNRKQQQQSQTENIMTNAECIRMQIEDSLGYHKILRATKIIELNEAEVLLAEIEKQKTKFFQLNCSMEELFEIEEKSGVTLVCTSCNTYEPFCISRTNTGLKVHYTEPQREAAKKYLLVEVTISDNINQIVSEAWKALSGSKRACHITRLLFDQQELERAVMAEHVEWLKSEYVLIK